MKLNNLFILALAGLGLVACEKNEANKQAEGTAAVSVKIVNSDMATKVAVDPTVPGAGSKYLQWTEANVKLTAASGIRNNTVTSDKLTTDFRDINGPSALEVSINGGKETYSINDLKGISAGDMHAYFKGTEFGTASDGSGDLAGYKVYTVDAKTAIPVARVEVSGIKVVEPTAGEQVFKTLTLSHVYMDGINKDATSTYPYTSAITKGTQHKSWAEYTAYDTENIFAEEVTGGEVITDGTPSGNAFPADNKVFAFNMFTQGSETGDKVKDNGMPILTLHFTNATLKNGTCNSDQYAIVTGYKTGDKYITKFEAGKIYTITSVEIATDKLIPDPTGELKYAVIANVTVQDWTVVNTTVEF